MVTFPSAVIVHDSQDLHNRSTMPSIFIVININVSEIMLHIGIYSTLRWHIHDLDQGYC